MQIQLKVNQTIMIKIIQDPGLKKSTKRKNSNCRQSTWSHHSKKTTQDNKIKKLVVLDKVQT